MKVVYANTSGVLAHAGQRVRVTAGEPWDGDDPLVARFPELFSASVRAVRTTRDPRGIIAVPEAAEVPDASAAPAVPVEQATAAPGERRATRRPTAASR